VAVRFEWDEAKRRANITKHGIDFGGARRLFEGYTVTVEDDRFDYGEQRFITFGLFDGEVVAVAHAETEDAIRVISMRKATKNEAKNYLSKIPAP
jgi:uncharacterized DUF497 family protein